MPLSDEAWQTLYDLGYATPGHSERPSSFVWPATGLRGSRRTRSTGACDAALKRACEKAGIVDCGWHTLRHTFASHLVMRGVPLRVVQEWLGHASIKMTEVYAHLSPGLDYSHYVNSLDRHLQPGLNTPRLPPGTPDAGVDSEKK